MYVGTHACGKSQNLVPIFPLRNTFPHLFNVSRELDAKDGGCSGRQGVFALSLGNVHAVQTEKLNLIAVSAVVLQHKQQIQTLTRTFPGPGIGFSASPR